MSSTRDTPPDRRAHWERVWAGRAPEAMSWHEDRPGVSLSLILPVTEPSDPVLDVGCGTGALLPALVDAGYHRLTGLDVSAEALRRLRDRMGPAARRVTLIEGDVLTAALPEGLVVWHDRAVLHFLLDDTERARYGEQVRRGLAPGGFVILGAFAPDGPERCSGLPVRRHGPEDFAALLGDEFVAETSLRHEHRTPSGAVQPFCFARFRRAP